MLGMLLASQGKGWREVFGEDTRDVGSQSVAVRIIVESWEQMSWLLGVIFALLTRWSEISPRALMAFTIKEPTHSAWPCLQ